MSINQTSNGNLGILLIKPDAIQENLENDIKAEIASMGLQIVHSQEYQFRLKDFFAFNTLEGSQGKEDQVLQFIKSYKSGSSLVLIVSGQSEDVDIIQKVLEVKRELRKKHFPYTEEHLRQIEQENRAQFNYIRSRNRVHCPDDEKEMKFLIKAIFSEKEVEYLKELGLKVYPTYPKEENKEMKRSIFPIN